jgi:hypothetical protein
MKISVIEALLVLAAFGTPAVGYSEEAGVKDAQLSLTLPGAPSKNPDEIMWVAHAKASLHSSATNYESLILLDMANRAYMRTGSADNLDLYLNRRREELDERKALADSSSMYIAPHPLGSLKESLEALKNLPMNALGPVGELAKGEIDTVLSVSGVLQGIDTKYSREGAQVWAQTQRASDIQEVQNLEDSILSTSYRIAQGNKKFAEAIDHTVTKDLGNISILEKAPRIVELDQNLKTNISLKQALRGIGDLQQGQRTAVSKDELRTLIAAHQKQTQTMVKDIIEAMNKKYDDLELFGIKTAQYEERRRKDNEERARKAAETELGIKAAESASFVIYSFANLIHPEFARDFRIVSNAGIQFANAINDFNKAAQYGELATKFGTVILTANMVGAAMTLMTLFASSGPSEFQLVSQQIDAMHRNLIRIGEVMNSRFDQVDREIRKVYDVMTKDFDLVKNSLDDLKEKIAEIQSDLKRLQARLFYLEERLATLERKELEWHQNNYTRDFEEKLRQCLEYKKDRPGVDLGLQAYEACRVAFITYALEGATKGVLTNSEVSADTATLIAQLQNYSFDFNLNYVLRAAQKLAGLNLSIRPISNISEWARGVDAYLSLRQQWPAYAKAESSEAIKQLEDSGIIAQQTLEAAIQNTQSEKWFDSLLSRYEVQLSRVSSAAFKTLSEFAEKNTRGIDPWNPKKAFELGKSEILNHTAVPNCDGIQGAPVLTINRFPQNKIPHEFWTGAQLGLWTLRACYQSNWVTTKTLKNDNVFAAVDKKFVGRVRLTLRLLAKTNDFEVAFGEVSAVDTADVEFREQYFVGDDNPGKIVWETPSSKQALQFWENVLKEQLEGTLFTKEIIQYFGQSESEYAAILLKIGTLGDRLIEKIEREKAAALEFLSAQVSGGANPDSDLQLALKDVRALQLLIRSLYAILFPHSILENEHLRSLLFGQDGYCLDSGAEFLSRYLARENPHWDPKENLASDLKQSESRSRKLREITQTMIAQNRKSFYETQARIQEELVKLGLTRLSIPPK